MWRVFSLGSRPLSLFQACGSPTASFHSYGGLCHPQPVERRPEVGNVENVNLDDSMQELKQHNNCVCVRERDKPVSPHLKDFSNLQRASSFFPRK